jgi:hypothetical protein
MTAGTAKEERKKEKTWSVKWGRAAHKGKADSPIVERGHERYAHVQVQIEIARRALQLVSGDLVITHTHTRHTPCC